MSTVVDFPGETRLNIPAEKILETAQLCELESVIVVGWKDDGDMYLSSSSSNVLEAIATLDVARAALVNDMVNAE